MVRADDDEKSERLVELFESSAWAVVLDRIKTHIGTKRATVFSGSLPHDKMIETVQEIRGVNLALNFIYRSADAEMPPDLLRAFE